MRCTMGLLKLVIVDDEPILLEGLVKTYDWNGMGYEVVGFAQSGEQALKVIREKKPHVVLTDIRMKQISGLMVMEEIKKENPECQFVVLSAYRDFEYAKKACDLGAFAYLLKPIEDEKLQATMTDVGKICEDQIRNEEKYDRWERLHLLFLPAAGSGHIFARQPAKIHLRPFSEVSPSGHTFPHF